jgi:hypothetical protein
VEMAVAGKRGRTKRPRHFFFSGSQDSPLWRQE